METVTFVTGNTYKFSVAQKALLHTDINLVQNDLNPPEIQSTSVTDIASNSALWASHQLQQPVIVTDVGYYIKALNGFPGPFIKWVNNWLSPSDYLHLLKGKTDRTIEVHEALAFCRPNEQPHVFSDIITATLAKRAGPNGYSPISSLYIPEGYTKVESRLSRETMVEYWAKYSTKWQQFINFYKTNS